MNEVIKKFEEDIEAYFKNHPHNKRLNKTISKKVISLANNGTVRILHNKLFFTYKNWKELAELQYIKERRQKVHYLVNNFIEEKIIHTKSEPFPKNLRLYSINKLSSHYLNTYLPNLDSTIDFKNKMIDILDQCSISELEKYLYLYIYLFLNKHFTHFQLTNLNEANYFLIEERLYFVLPHNLDINVKQSSFDVIDFDPYISKNIKRYLESFNGKNLFSHNYIFTLPQKDYIAFINKKIKKYDDNLGIKIIKDAIKLDIQLTTSPYFTTISNWKIYPKQTLIELDRLYPNTVPKVFIDRELTLKNNKIDSIETKNKDIFDTLEEELAEEDITLEIIRSIYKLKTNPKFVYKKKISSFIKSLQKTVLHNDNEIERKITAYLIERLQSILNNLLAPQTFRENLRVLNTYLFFSALYAKQLTTDMFIKIQQNIHDNEQIEDTSKAKYIQILNHFFSFSYSTKIDTVIANSHTHRSMVFNDELQELVSILIQQDKQTFNIQVNQSKNFYKSHMRTVFLILLRYSGLRKNELRSRRLSDWYRTDTGYAIDVNRKGFKQMLNLLPNEENKGLKNRAARRRVAFTIDDPALRYIIDKFYDICQKMNKKFVFLEVTENTIYSKPVPLSTIDALNTFMQSILDREIVLHSLRHSYITYNITRILVNDETNTQKEVFELCNMVGQSDPTVMINNYLHIDHLKHFIQQYKKH